MPPSARKSPSKTPTAGGTEAALRRAAPGRCPAGSGPEELGPGAQLRGGGVRADPAPQVAPPPRSAERAVSVGRGVRGHVTAAIRARADARRHASSLPLRLPGSHGHPPAAAAAPAPGSTMAGTLRAAHAPPAQPRRPSPAASPQPWPGSSRPEDRRKVATGSRRAWRFLLQRPPRHPGARRWVPGRVWPRGAPSRPSFPPPAGWRLWRGGREAGTPAARPGSWASRPGAGCHAEPIFRPLGPGFGRPEPSSGRAPAHLLAVPAAGRGRPGAEVTGPPCGG